MADTSLFGSVYNPDVLSCLANLSNDEVFTPPEIANEILDMLPQELFENPDTTFLDPACKSGVFLREIAKRLIKGLEWQFPDLQERIDHIFRHQIYGIAITELTSLLSRRSVYCSKYPNSEFSVSCFDNPQGNIRFKRIKHTWGKTTYDSKGNPHASCVFCGASKEQYDRDDALETHAYELIHRTSPKEIFNMKFDVIIGNPPYQLGSNDSRSTSRDKPIYNLFIDQAKKLNPKYLTMIIPSRWMATGLGLSEFREKMLNDKHIRRLVDYPVASEVFQGVEIKGGVCYFLWDRDNPGSCEVSTIRNQEVLGPYERDLGEYDIFVRDIRGLSILKKVLSYNEDSITEIMSADKEFGWTSNFNGFHENKESKNDVPLYYNRTGKRLIGWINRVEVPKSKHLIDTWKVLIPKAGSDGGQKIPDVVLGTPQIAGNPSVCTQTYLFFYTDTQEKAINIEKYLKTKFFRFLVSLRKITQDATKSTYTWVPKQDFSIEWKDDDLYQKYKLSSDEIDYIEYLIKAMDGGSTDGE